MRETEVGSPESSHLELFPGGNFAGKVEENRLQIEITEPATSPTRMPSHCVP